MGLENLQDSSFLAKLTDHILADGVCCLPTDTIYALASSAISDTAVVKIFEYKKRAYNKPLPILFDSIKRIERFCQINPLEYAIVRNCMPAALSILLNLRVDSEVKLSKYVNLGLNKVAVRIPDDQFIQDLISASNCPLVGTSANLHSCPPISSREESLMIFDEEVLFCDHKNWDSYDSLHFPKLASTIIQVSEIRQEEAQHLESNKILMPYIVLEFCNKQYMIQIIRQGDITLNDILIKIVDGKQHGNNI